MKIFLPTRLLLRALFFWIKQRSLQSGFLFFPRYITNYHELFFPAMSLLKTPGKFILNKRQNI